MKRIFDNDGVVCGSVDCCSGPDDKPMTEPGQMLFHAMTSVVGDTSVHSQSATSEKVFQCQMWKIINPGVRRRRCGIMLPLVFAQILLSTAVTVLSSSSSSIPQRQPKNNECTLYLAPSTIPGAGLGIFTGSRPFKKGEQMAPPDIMVPAYDLEWNNGYKDFNFLWDEYTWSTCKFDGDLFESYGYSVTRCRGG
jgi:hypothetical protein